MNAPTVEHISECFVKPQYESEEMKQPFHLAAWDLAMLSVHYIQKGLLFLRPPPHPIQPLLESLKLSLSIALVHFYPLAGRLSTLKQDNPPLYSVSIDCSNSPGARFIHASLKLRVSDILSPPDVPPVVQSFFDHHRAICHDGHTMSLLSIQVTELLDGVFIGFSMNHMVVDGTSYWHFINMLSEIFTAREGGTDIIPISRPPVHRRWLPEGWGPVVNLPFTHHDQYINRFEAPKLRERVFHFSAESMAKLKAKANAEWSKPSGVTISSLQALSAQMWRCVTRARRLPPDQQTSCRMAFNNRRRMEPPLPPDYFGNSIQAVRGTSTAGELLQHNLGWAAWLLHQAVTEQNNGSVRQWVEEWLQAPSVYHIGQAFDPCSIMMGSSPRFDMYGNTFGLGKAVAIRSGYANKFDGKVSLYPGREGGGSMDLEVCLKPEFMAAFESDEEFIAAIL